MAAGAARPAVPEVEWLALKNKTFFQGANNLLRLAIVLIIARAFTGKEGVDGVMKIVTPDGVQAVAAIFTRKNQARIILVTFGDHADFAIEFVGELSHFLGDFLEDVRRRIVLDGLHGIQTQTVEMIVMDPVARVLGYIVADAFGSGLIVIYGFAPRRGVLVSEIRTEHAQVIAFITQVVVNHVKDHGEPEFMGCVNKTAQSFRSAIAFLDGEK